MPAAAVIPAPIAYIKVVAVKKLVVELTRAGAVHPSVGRYCGGLCPSAVSRDVVRSASRRTAPVTLRKLECSKRACLPEYVSME